MHPTPFTRRTTVLFGIFCTSLLSGVALGQSAPQAAEILGRRTLKAARIEGPPPRIDGRLDEAVWASAPIATDFVENRPKPGTLASLVSRARVLVDDEAIYIGLEYDDPTPSTIAAPLARRDDETISDWAFVEIDSRHDHRSAFSFGVNPRGVQVDGAWFADTNYDSAWNAVWEAAATTGEHGWTIEYRIPFSQLAFALPSGTTELAWGINFYRYSPGHSESSNWSPRYAALGGVVSNFNEVSIPAPSHVRRMEAIPFLVGRTGDVSPSDQAVSAGADLRAGLGPRFRLTATLLPDFGQVEADPSQVNLSAFELFQTEQRPFFLEGLDVFRFDTNLAYSARDASFSDESPFYSRRVGSAPRGSIPDGFELISRPTATSLLGAAKLVGETDGGWTLGGFAAASDSEVAQVRDESGRQSRLSIGPRSLFGVARALRSFAKGDGSFGIFAAGNDRLAMPEALSQELVRSAASLGVDFRRRFSQRNYELRAWVLATELAGTTEAIRAVAESPRHLFQRPDGERFRTEGYGSSLNGLSAEGTVARVNGALRWSLTARGVSPGFDIGETGYQQSSDWLLLAGTWRLERYPAGSRVRTWAVGSDSTGAGWTSSGDLRSAVVSAYGSLETQSTETAKITLTHAMPALAIGWLRGGPALLLPARDSVGISLASNQSHPSYATLDTSVETEPASGSWAASISPLWNVRSSDQLQWSVGPAFRVDTVGWQPIGRIPLGSTRRDLVARVAQRTVSLTLRADWIFSPRLSLQFYAQPFATVGRYDRYQILRDARAAQASDRFAPLCPSCVVSASGSLALDLDGDGIQESTIAAPDAAERSLNASLVVRWEVRPGSFLTLIWNHQRAGANGDVSRSPAGALGSLGGDAGTNVVLAKLSWRLGS
ncbi:MAG: DUF5916 domain-containing protein [Acidobacteriota bacterium]